jgi:hypothetical protein
VLFDLDGTLTASAGRHPAASRALEVVGRPVVDPASSCRIGPPLVEVRR